MTARICFALILFFITYPVHAELDPFATMQAHFAAVDKQISEARERMKRNQELLKNSAAQTINVNPEFNTTEDENAYTVTLRMQGLDQNSVDVQLENAMLKIKGERKATIESEKIKSASYSAFTKSLFLPLAGDSSGLDLRSEPDTVIITVPKKKT